MPEQEPTTSPYRDVDRLAAQVQASRAQMRERIREAAGAGPEAEEVSPVRHFGRLYESLTGDP